MRLIVKFFPEITIKSTSVRLFFIKVLIRNIHTVLSFYNFFVKIKRYWDYIEICIDKKNSFLDIIEILIRVSGIHHIFLVEKYCFKDMHDIFKIIISIYKTKLVGKSFCVRVKRTGVHVFTSQDLECYLGDMLCKNIINTFVNLKTPEELVSLEVRDNNFFLLKNRYKGLSGFPIGTQGEVLSLISGGFDSGVASYMFMRRGCKVNYCFFKLGGDVHEDRVYEMVYFLWKRFGCSHPVKFISVDFSSVVDEILNKINHIQIGMILKRMMIRAAAFIAKNLEISALVTGEVLGQVSSQTLVNLQLINSVSDIMIFRPLISYDKEDIISLSRMIEIESFSNNIPEYCGIIANKSTAKSSIRDIKREEEKFDFSVLNVSIERKKIINLRKLISIVNAREKDIKFVTELNYDYVIIDIRTEQEIKSKPLFLDCLEIKKIPFYKLSTVFSTLDQSRMYLLYCGRGIMSRCQVLYLRNQGFKNVNVYLP